MVQKHSSDGKLRALQWRTQTKNNPWGTGRTVCGEAKTKSNLRENRVKSPTGNRHRESVHRENSRGRFVGLKENSTIVTWRSNAEDQLAASLTLSQLLMSWWGAGARPWLELGNGYPLGGAEGTGSRARARRPGLTSTYKTLYSVIFSPPGHQGGIISRRRHRFLNS